MLKQFSSLRRRISFRAVLLLLAVLLTMPCSGCKKSADPVKSDPAEDVPVNLVYYTIGKPDEDLAAVNEELNKILAERYGFTVEYHKIGWNDYPKQITSIINTKQNYDIAFASTNLYVTNASNGNWMDLTSYLENDGRQLYETVNEKFWKGVTINERIYGVPTNKELASPLQLLFSKELVDKYGIDTSKYRTLESLEPILRAIAAGEPGCIPLFFESTKINLLSMGGYEFVSYDTIPLVIDIDDEDCQVMNLFETDYAKQTLDTLRRYYLSGYINQDASLRTSFSLFPDENIFLRFSSGGPDAAISFSNSCGYPIVTEQASPSVINTESAQGGVMVVNSNTLHPEECFLFLQAVNTDPEVRNLLNFGIEGIHYTLTENDQVQFISDRYQGVSYTQGNWFILKTTVGEPVDKWEHYARFNSEAIESPLLGFSPDYSNYSRQYHEVSQIYDKYYVPLMTGTVDPAVYLPRFLTELEEAGINDLKLALQYQIDDWLARK